MSIHATDEGVMREFALKLPAFRMVVNTPAPHGSVGHTTRLFPSMSLGCGTPGGNITSDNISPMHLLNVKRLAYQRRPINRPESVYSTRSPALQAPHEPAGAFAASRPSRTQDQISHIVERFVAARARTTATPPPASR